MKALCGSPFLSAVHTPTIQPGPAAQNRPHGSARWAFQLPLRPLVPTSPRGRGSWRGDIAAGNCRARYPADGRRGRLGVEPVARACQAGSLACRGGPGQRKLGPVTLD